MNKVIAIVGMCGSGKSVATDYFTENGYEKVYFGGVTMDKLKELNLEVNPENEKMIRENLREEFGMGAYAILLLPKINELLKVKNVVLDGLYSWDELKILKESFQNLKVISIVANKDLRYNRLKNRKIRPLNSNQACKRDVAELETLAKGAPIAFADYFILNNGSLSEYQIELEKIKMEV